MTQYTKWISMIIVSSVGMMMGVSSAATTLYSSMETGGTSLGAIAFVNTMDDVWTSNFPASLITLGSGDLTGLVSGVNPITINYNSCGGGAAVTVTLVNFTGGTTSIIAATTTQPSISPGSSQQSNSPKPNQYGPVNDWGENLGLQSDRNAVVFDFASPVAGFGAWFGDLETSVHGTLAEVYLYNASGTILYSGFINPDVTPADEGLICTGTGAGCGNVTTRFIGFASDVVIAKMIVVVGDDDLGGNGFKEHLSFAAPLIACQTYTISASTFLDTNNNGLQDGTEGNLTTIPRIRSSNGMTGTIMFNSSGFALLTGLVPGNYTISIDTTDPDYVALLNAGALITTGMISQSVVITTKNITGIVLGLYTPSSDLSITKVVNTGIVTNGTTVVYTIKILNNGPNTATGWLMVDNLPSYLGSVTTSNGTIMSGQILYSGASLASGASTTITVTAIITGLITNATTISNTAFVKFSGNETTVNNNTATALTTGFVMNPIMTGGLSGQVYYDTNINGMMDTGENFATGITFVISHASGFIFTGMTSNSGGYMVTNLTGGLYTVTIIPTSGMFVTTINPSTVTVVAGTTTYAGSDGLAQTPTTPIINIAVTKTANVTTIMNGGQIIYTITYSNLGTTIASGVTITDTFSGGVMTIISSSLSGSALLGTLAGTNSYIRSIGTLSPGQTGILTVTMLYSGNTNSTIPNTANITILSGETVTGNNTAVVSVSSLTSPLPIVNNGGGGGGGRYIDYPIGYFGNSGTNIITGTNPTTGTVTIIADPALIINNGQIRQIQLDLMAYYQANNGRDFPQDVVIEVVRKAVIPGVYKTTYVYKAPKNYRRLTNSKYKVVKKYHYRTLPNSGVNL